MLRNQKDEIVLVLQKIARIEKELKKDKEHLNGDERKLNKCIDKLFILICPLINEKPEKFRE